MERFVQLIVAGGISLVAGLWLLTLAPLMSVVWLGGVALVVFGSSGLVVGIKSEITTP